MHIIFNYTNNFYINTYNIIQQQSINITICITALIYTFKLISITFTTKFSYKYHDKIQRYIT